METRLVATTVHGRYLFRDRGQRLLAGFHGYAETADIHVAQLDQIPGVEAWSIAAIQALHPFYTRNDQAVVASWMTRMDREHAIADNIDYIRTVLGEIGNRRPLVFLGFSQGAAMAYRAAAHIRCDGLVILGGDLPPDVAAQESVQLAPRILIGRGKSDDWFNDEKLKKDLSFLRGVADVTTCVYDGGHEWTDEFRQAAGAFLQTV